MMGDEEIESRGRDATRVPNWAVATTLVYIILSLS